MNILDRRFRYIPAAKQDQEGVLARWLRQVEAERVRQAQEQKPNVTLLRKTK